MIQTQGDNYEEDPTRDQLEIEGEEDTRAVAATIFGLPRMVVIVGAVVFLLIVLLLVLIATRGKGGKQGGNDVPIDPNPIVDWNDNDDYFSDPGNIFIDDGGGLDIGVGSGDYGLSVGVDDGGISVGGGDDGGGLSIGVDGGNDYVPEDVVPVYDGDLTPALDAYAESLRKYGYTGDEISVAQRMGIPLEDLIYHSDEMMQAAAEEAALAAEDVNSDSYKEMKKFSIFSLKAFKFENYEGRPETLKTDSIVVNADYEKCPTRGYQLFLKIKFAENAYVFHAITPERWNVLPQTGNIVVRIRYTYIGNKNPRLYVTGVEEVKASDYTVGDGQTLFDN